MPQVSKLPSGEVLLAHITGGMTPKDFAALYGVQPGAMYSRLKAASYQTKVYAAHRPRVAWREARAIRLSSVHGNRKMPAASTLEQALFDEPDITPQQLADRYSVTLRTAYRHLRLRRLGQVKPKRGPVHKRAEDASETTQVPAIRNTLEGTR